MYNKTGDSAQTAGRRDVLKMGIAAAGLAGVSSSLGAAQSATDEGEDDATLEPGDGIEITDSQVHVGREGFAALLDVMDRIGVKSTLLYEYWGYGIEGLQHHAMPGFALPNGAARAVSTVATEAALVHPDRFGSVVKIDRRDPELRCVLQLHASSPCVKGVRILPVWTTAEAEVFASGGYSDVFSLVEEMQVPAFLFIPGHVGAMRQYLEKFPRLKCIIDHTGMPFRNIPADAPGSDGPLSPDYFEHVFEMARYDNVCLKWSHANKLFGEENSSHEAMRPYLRQAIDAFGADRVMWASDHTVIPDHSWPELLEAVLDNPDLDLVEKRWILGGSVRKALGWT